MKEDTEVSLEDQEVWLKVYHTGYFASFREQSLAVNIRIPNPNFGESDCFEGTTCLFAPINADEKGNVDLTPLFHTWLEKIKDSPGCDVRAYATGFIRQFHFNPKLLSTPVPQSLIDLFSISGDKCEQNDK